MRLRIVYFIARLLNVQIASENDLKVIEYQKAHAEAIVAACQRKLERFEAKLAELEKSIPGAMLDPREKKSKWEK